MKELKYKTKSFKRLGDELRTTIFSDGMANLQIRCVDGSMRQIVLTELQLKKLIEYMQGKP